MTGNGFYMVAISADVVPNIGPGVCVSDVWVEACPSEVVGCVSSSDDIALSGLISPPLDTMGAFPFIATV